MMMSKPVNVNVGVDGTVIIDGELDGCDLRLNPRGNHTMSFYVALTTCE